MSSLGGDDSDKFIDIANATPLEGNDIKEEKGFKVLTLNKLLLSKRWLSWDSDVWNWIYQNKQWIFSKE